MATERRTGRRSALEAWDEANRSIPFAERTDALEAACGDILANHRVAESLIRRTDDLFNIGYRGERVCEDSRGSGTISNRNDVAMDVLAILASDGDGFDDGWGYEVETRVVADELRPVSIEWIVPKTSRACWLWTREWLSDSSAATATLHEAGDPPDAELPDGAPPLRTTGNDWFEIVRSLIEFQYWVEANPDPDLLEEYEDVRSGDRADVHERLSDWVAFDRYQVRTGFDLRSVELLETIDEDTVVLLLEVGPGTITRYAEGEVVDTIESDSYRELGVFRRSPYDERWRWLTLSFIVQIDA